MPQSDSTCWTVLQHAAAGSIEARASFAERYAPLVRAYMSARWRGSPLIREVEDAVQDVFVECLRQGGALEKADADRAGGFRAFLYGVARNVALRVERNHARRRDRSPLEIHADSPGDDESLSRVFDRAWAVALMKQAAERQKEWAAQRDSAAQKRVELLHLRFHEGLPIREIAKRWQVDASFLHHEYARARQEFKTALLEVLHHFHPDNPIAADRECQALLEALE